MAASLSFNDGSGTQTITVPTALGRFNRWKPKPMTIGERAIAVGDGTLHQWSHRTDYGASFEVPLIANTQEAVVQDFLEWVNSGGTFTVTTGDSESNTYTDIQMAPGFLAELSDPDPETLEYTLALDVINVATVPVRMRCVY